MLVRISLGMLQFGHDENDCSENGNKFQIRSLLIIIYDFCLDFEMGHDLNKCDANEEEWPTMDIGDL